jgi:hypothetical protein
VKRFAYGLLSSSSYATGQDSPQSNLSLSVTAHVSLRSSRTKGGALVRSPATRWMWLKDPLAGAAPAFPPEPTDAADQLRKLRQRRDEDY